MIGEGIIMYVYPCDFMKLDMLGDDNIGIKKPLIVRIVPMTMHS